MIHLADAALVAWLSTMDQPVEVVVGPPPQREPGSRRAHRPVLAVELVSVREQVERRDNDVRDVRDEDGRVVARQRSSRWFELDYRCSATGDHVEAHRVLGAVLQLLVDSDVVPAEHVPTDLAPCDVPITVQFAPDGASTAAGVGIRLVVPVRPTAEREISAPAVAFHLDVAPPPGRTASGGDDGDAPPTAGDPLERAWTTVRRREFIAGPRPDAAARRTDA